ncbi:glutathione S- transferase, nitrogen catabolite repression regulator [Acarospora aff. strigata]|nr:glutathione S- transferase, nitrogen catabolite repression regulator [Acarospora aff. strigata]
MSQPIILDSHATGLNPWKVTIILEELGLKYENKSLELTEMKKPAFEKIYPNGRLEYSVPAIEDPNTGILLWESGAIIVYLIDRYDTSAGLTYTSTPERYHLKRWLHFQVSGQGPYWG